MNILLDMDKIKNKITEMVDMLYKDPKIFGIVSFIVNMVIIICIYHFNPYNFNEKYPLHIFFIILFILLINVMTFYFIRVKKEINDSNISSSDIYKKLPFFENYYNYIKENGYLLLYLVLTVISIYYIFSFFYNNELSINTFETLFINFINLFIIIGVLSILYITLKNTSSSIDNNETRIHVLFLNLLRNIIFYIPCLFIDIIEFIKSEYEITTSTIWIILIIEIILISMYFIIPKIIHKIVSHDGIELLNEPKYLNNNHLLATYQNLNEIIDKNISSYDNNENSKFKYTYALSCWYYINPQPPNTNQSYTKFSTILDYGGKPIIEFNPLKNKLRIRCELSNGNFKTLYETTNIKYQKWNNIVINYDAGTMDIFINGILVSSTPSISPYMTYESVVVGQNNGIHGGICNVNYYKHVLSSSKINSIYKILKIKDIPLI